MNNAMITFETVHAATNSPRSKSNPSPAIITTAQALFMNFCKRFAPARMFFGMTPVADKITTNRIIYAYSWIGAPAIVGKIAPANNCPNA